jgi:SAM-dependent methyltransferase
MEAHRARVDGTLPPTGILLMECPLCRSSSLRLHAEAYGRRYLRCSTCWLTLLDPVHRLGAAAERAHYETHENDPGDPRYRRFLARLAEPLVQRLESRAEGLDYGSGPGPTLSLMLEEQGYGLEIFDPYFAPDRSVLRRSYDFITCTEVVEHFASPREEFDRMDRVLRPGGLLAVMTELVREECRFAEWRYARDPTHVSFFHTATMHWIAEHYRWRTESPERNVVFFRKAGAVAERRVAGAE